MYVHGGRRIVEGDGKGWGKVTVRWNVTTMGRLETLAKTRPRPPHVQGYESRPGGRVQVDVLM